MVSLYSREARVLRTLGWDDGFRKEYQEVLAEGLRLWH
jgi:hypothetical protein